VTNHPPFPTPRLVSIDRRQILLRTVDVEKLIDEDHSARSLWELIGRLDLTLYHAQIAAVEGHAGREHTDPQLLISLWLYAYSRGGLRQFRCRNRLKVAMEATWACLSYNLTRCFSIQHKPNLETASA